MYTIQRISRTQTNHWFDSGEQAQAFFKRIDKRVIPYDNVSLDGKLVTVHFFEENHIHS